MFRTETKISQILKQQEFSLKNIKRKHESSPYPPSSTPPHEDGKTRSQECDRAGQNQPWGWEEDEEEAYFALTSL